MRSFGQSLGSLTDDEGASKASLTWPVRISVAQIFPQVFLSGRPGEALPQGNGPSQVDLLPQVVSALDLHMLDPTLLNDLLAAGGVQGAAHVDDDDGDVFEGRLL
jgi:hypothetical protein